MTRGDSKAKNTRRSVHHPHEGEERPGWSTAFKKTLNRGSVNSIWKKHVRRNPIRCSVFREAVFTCEDAVGYGEVDFEFQGFVVFVLVQDGNHPTAKKILRNVPGGHVVADVFLT